jgi:HK97 family phage major capsid protein
MYGLLAPYGQNATWLMSSLTAAFLTKIKDADGNLIWRESLIPGQPSTLLGRPVEIDEGMAGPMPARSPSHSATSRRAISSTTGSERASSAIPTPTSLTSCST